MENVNFAGEYYTRDSVKGGIPNISSWQKCCELCQKDTKCAHWSWRREGSSAHYNHRCHLKKSGATKQINYSGVVSGGPTTCGAKGGKIILVPFNHIFL
jgi:hypothetical protein